MDWLLLISKVVAGVIGLTYMCALGFFIAYMNRFDDEG